MPTELARAVLLLTWLLVPELPLRILPMQRTQKALLATLLIAATVALGYALAGIPNVELMTITVFISGYLLGAKLGAIVGAVSIAVYSVFNPMGSSVGVPLLLVAQVVAFAVIGVAGSILGGVVAKLPRVGAIIVAGVTGLVLTSLYDALTNIGAFYSITGEDAPTNLLKFIIGGIVFVVMHLVWNTALFAVALKPTLNVLARYRRELA